MAAPAFAEAQSPPRLTPAERTRLIQDLSILAHDSMEGRRAGTPGIEKARRYLLAQFPARGMEPLPGNPSPAWTREFAIGAGAAGVNILGIVRGTERTDRYLVVTAHYDHLGVRNGQIYNGADDNASGTAALLALASHFAANPPRTSIVFAALDAEEGGLVGARAFLRDPPIPLDAILMNVNLDMVSRSDRGEIYAAGTYHAPWLTPIVDEVAARSSVRLLTGHDRPGLPPGDDWTDASDHGPFHQAGIPFLYFGVEDHAGYHQPSDDFEAVPRDFYVGAVETVLDFLRTADARGEELMARRVAR